MSNYDKSLNMETKCHHWGFLSIVLLIMFFSVLALVGVGLLWGCTNPFIRLGTEGVDRFNTGSSSKNLWLELTFIAVRLKYWIPFLLNQLGSVLYVWTLQFTNIIVAVPVANSLTFVFTAITGYWLGEKIPGKKVIIGSCFVCLGSSLMLYDQMSRELPEDALRPN